MTECELAAWERFQETARPAFLVYQAAAGAGTKWREAAAWRRYLTATEAARQVYQAHPATLARLAAMERDQPT